MTTNDSMKERLQRPGPWFLTFAHPYREVVTLKKTSSEKWGFSCKFVDETSKCLMIVEIRAGPLKAHNLRVYPEQRIKKGDLIEEVNSVRSSAQHLNEAIITG